MTRRLVVPALLLAAAAPLPGQGRGEVELARLPFPVRVDGAVTDSAWDLMSPCRSRCTRRSSGRGPPSGARSGWLRRRVSLRLRPVLRFAAGPAQGWLEVIHNLEDVREPFEPGDGVTIERGTHRFAELWLNWQAPAGPLLRADVDARIGGFYDGWRVRPLVEPTWNLSRHLEVGGGYELNRIRFPERGRSLDAHVARLRVGAAANVRLSATVLAQLNTVDDRLGLNLRVRYNFSEGSDRWVVYDEGLNTDRESLPGEPRLPLSDSRVLLVKLTPTFIP